MRNNYNDIIDIILTLTSDKDIAKNIVICGDIVPYIILEKEPTTVIKNLYFLIKSNKYNLILKKLKKLSDVYLFDIVSNTKKLCGLEYGFKIKYENILVGFYPYLSKNDVFIIKTFFHDEKKCKMDLKTKFIDNINENKVIRKICFNDMEDVSIIIPEFILVDKELSSNKGYYEVDIFNDLKKVCDNDMIDFIRSNIQKSRVEIISKDIRNKNLFIKFFLILLFFVLILISYICFKK